MPNPEIDYRGYERPLPKPGSEMAEILRRVTAGEEVLWINVPATLKAGLWQYAASESETRYAAVELREAVLAKIAREW